MITIIIFLLYFKYYVAFDFNFDKIDFNNYENTITIYYEQGTSGKKDQYLYDTKKKIVQNCNNITKIKTNNGTINYEKNDSYMIDYATSSITNTKAQCIRHIDLADNTNEIILTTDEIKTQYNEEYFGIDQLNYDAKNNKLLFRINQNRNSIIVSYDLKSKTMSEIVKYKSISHQYFSSLDYIINNNKIYIINLDYQLCIYDILTNKLYKTNCYTYNYTVSSDGNEVYYVDLENNLCKYRVDSDEAVLIVKNNYKIERMDIDKTKNLLLFVKTLDKKTWTGIDIYNVFKQNELVIYEISTGKSQIIVRPSLSKVIFDSYFINEEK